MNRFDRIIAILIHLQSRKVVTAQDMADRFEVSLRTIYRDVKSLEEAGVPILSEAGKGYMIMDGYRLPPVMFTQEEALTFVTADKLMQRFTDYNLNKAYSAAIYKIKAVLRSADKSLIESIQDQIVVMDNPYLPDKKEIPLDTLLKALSQNLKVEIHYFSNNKQENTIRIVEPVGVFQIGDNWRLIAFCLLRNDYRDFRLDRISKIKITSEKFTASHPSLQSFMEKEKKERQLTDVEIVVHKRHLRYFGDQKYYMGYISQENVEDMVHLKFLAPSIMGFARWLTMYGDIVTVIKPQQLIDETVTLCEKIIENISKPSSC